jgi:hypothetical protein
VYVEFGPTHIEAYKNFDLRSSFNTKYRGILVQNEKFFGTLFLKEIYVPYKQN